MRTALACSKKVHHNARYSKKKKNLVQRRGAFSSALWFMDCVEGKKWAAASGCTFQIHFFTIIIINNPSPVSLPTVRSNSLWSRIWYIFYVCLIWSLGTLAVLIRPWAEIFAAHFRYIFSPSSIPHLIHYPRPLCAQTLYIVKFRFYKHFKVLRCWFVWSGFLELGTIHKRCCQFFRIFDTPLPHDGSFLVLFVGNFDQFIKIQYYRILRLPAAVCSLKIKKKMRL